MRHLILFLITILTATLGHSQGCLNVEYYPNVKYLLKKYRNTTVSDYCSSKDRIIISLLNEAGNIEIAREKAQLFEKVNQFDNTNDAAEVLTTYALLLDVEGKSEAAHYLYEYVSKFPNIRHVLKTSLRFRIAAYNPSIGLVKKLKVTLDSIIQTSTYSGDEKAIIAIDYFDILRSERKANFGQEYYHLSDNTLDPLIEYLLVWNSALGLDTGDPKFKEYYKHLDRITRKIDQFDLKSDQLRIEANFLLENKDYGLAHQKALALLSHQYGKEISEISAVTIADSINLVRGDGIALAMYARTNLFRTRLGEGIEVVKQSSKIYDKIDRADLRRRILLSPDITSHKVAGIETSFLNSLIIAMYLNSTTGDNTYLNSSITLADIFPSLGLYSHLITNSAKREDSELRTALSDLENSIYQGENGSDFKTTIDLHLFNERINKKRDSIYQRFPSFTQKLSNGFEVDLSATQQKLEEEIEGAIAYYMGKRFLYRLLVSTDTIRIDDLTSYTKEVDSLSTKVQALAPYRVDGEELARSSHRLYELLLGDIDSLLPASLHIVANESLETLPFNVLRKDSLAPSGQERYLGVEHAISRQFSLRTMELLNELDPAPEYRQPLVFAPIFERGSQVPSSTAEGAVRYLTPLKASAEEVQSLKNLSGGSFNLGSKATADRYMQHAARYGILHLATHAVSNPVDGLDSRVYLMDDTGEPVAVTAGEISRQDLNAELVTLSACETSRGGQNTIEGTIGLTRAFLAAGAKTVVSTGWAVDDRATAEIMAYFYQHLAEGKATNIALQAARKDYLGAHPGAHPSRWAAFESFGGQGPVDWDRSKPWYAQLAWYTWASVLGGIALLIGLLYTRKTSRA